jgi:hypothetical protein
MAFSLNEGSPETGQPQPLTGDQSDINAHFVHQSLSWEAHARSGGGKANEKEPRSRRSRPGLAALAPPAIGGSAGFSSHPGTYPLCRFTRLISPARGDTIVGLQGPKRRGVAAALEKEGLIVRTVDMNHLVWAQADPNARRCGHAGIGIRLFKDDRAHGAATVVPLKERYEALAAERR